ncbi:MAG: permease, partial [Paracoccaceae bacterium]|nr:permease [Paracoccaceae bacterium]
SSIAAGHNLQQAVLHGSACASITVSKPGCAPAMADSETLATFLQNHPGPTTI